MPDDATRAHPSDPAPGEGHPAGSTRATWADGLVSVGFDSAAVAEALSAGSDAVPAAARDVTPEADGRYARVAALGAGGMGQVALVDDRHLHRQVARKELHAQRPAIALRFLREARITAQLEHPGIVPVYELGRDAGGRLYYTMKRVRGRTLREALDQAADASARLALISPFVEVCQAVGYAHSKGVVHRDLKPENVMIGPFGETLVLDWGLAKVAGEPELRGEVGMGSGSGLTRAGTVMGTPRYMSPEQADGRLDDIDARSDVWSLGVMLYEILAGEVPFDGPADSVIRQVRQGVVTPVREAARAVPAELAAICAKALGSSPGERYDHAGEIAEELEAWRAGATVGAHTYSPVEQARRLVDRFRAGLVLLVGVGLALGLAWIWWAPRMDAARAQIAQHTAREAVLERLIGSWAAEDPARALALARDATRTATGIDRERAEARVRELLAAGADVRVFPRPDGAGPPFWSPDGSLAWTDAAGVTVVDPASGSTLGHVPAPGVRVAGFSPDGANLRLADGSSLWEVSLVDLRELRRVPLPIHRSPDGAGEFLRAPDGLVSHPDGVRVSLTGEGSVVVDLRAGTVTPGPAGWDVPEVQSRRDDLEVLGSEVRLRSRKVGAAIPATNLRVCEDGRIVPVLPFPRAQDLDAGKACAR